jgi:hypothetical protein
MATEECVLCAETRQQPNSRLTQACGHCEAEEIETQPHLEPNGDYFQVVLVTRMWRRRACFCGRELTLSISKIDTFPSKEAGINRPDSRTEQGQGCCECCEKNVNSSICRLREGAPQFDKARDATGDWRPQTQ